VSPTRPVTYAHAGKRSPPCSACSVHRLSRSRFNNLGNEMPARATGYGAVGEILGKMFETFKGMFASANGPDPHDVASAIDKLIAAPKGARAARLVVGQGFGAAAVNDAVAPIQHRVLESLGLGALAILAKQAV